MLVNWLLSIKKKQKDKRMSFYLSDVHLRSPQRPPGYLCHDPVLHQISQAQIVALKARRGTVR